MINLTYLKGKKGQLRCLKHVKFKNDEKRKFNHFGKNQIKNIIAAYIENLFFQNKEWAQNISILLIPYNTNADNGYLGNKKHEIKSFVFITLVASVIKPLWPKSLKWSEYMHWKKDMKRNIWSIFDKLKIYPCVKFSQIKLNKIIKGFSGIIRILTKTYLIRGTHFLCNFLINNTWYGSNTS